MTLVRVPFDVENRPRALRVAQVAAQAHAHAALGWSRHFRAPAPACLVVVADDTWPTDEPDDMANAAGVAAVRVTSGLAWRLAREVPPPTPSTGGTVVFVSVRKRRLALTTWGLLWAWSRIVLDGGTGHGTAVRLARLALVRAIITTQGWKELAAAHAEMTGESVRASVSRPATERAASIDDGPWPSGMRCFEPAETWEHLYKRLDAQLLDVRMMAEHVPLEEPILARQQADALRRLLDERVERSKWIAQDPLGRFVPGSSEGLPPGIHLFCRKILQCAQQAELDPSVLAWHVFWHELSHARVHEHDVKGDLPVDLSSIDLEEALCEAMAMQATRQGGHPLLEVDGPPYPQGWRLEHWRGVEALAPYMHYVGARAIEVALPLGAALDLVRVWRRLARKALGAVDGDAIRARMLVNDMAQLLQGRAATP